MTSNPSGQGFQNKNRVAIFAERDEEKRKLLMQNKSFTNHSGANISLVRSSLTKDFQDHTEQQHIAAQILFTAHSSGYFITGVANLLDLGDHHTHNFKSQGPLAGSVGGLGAAHN
ncbi:SOSS complex subunit C, partial [Ophiophagus hannah]